MTAAIAFIVIGVIGLNKGYERPGQFRGLLAVPADAHEASYGRAGYVAVLQEGQRA